MKVEGDFHIRDRNGSPGPVVDTGKVTIRTEHPCPIALKPPIKAADLLEGPKITPQPAADPTPAPQIVETTQTTVNEYDGGKLIRWPTTPQQVGNPDVYGAWGHYISDCTVKLPCPTSSQVCTASAESGIWGENYVGHRVTAGQRLSVTSAGGNQYWDRNTSCDASDWCRAEDMVKIRGGETTTITCHGQRDSGPGPNRAKVGCSLNLDYRG